MTQPKDYSLNELVAQCDPDALPFPEIWLVLSDKRGDNGQVEIIAETLAARLGWSYERRNVVMRPAYVKGKPRVGATLYHIDRVQSDALNPPWPDIIITCGQRPANVALWIKKKSEGRTRIVLIGKAPGHPSNFDLVVTSAEILAPQLPNLLNIGLPLMRIDSGRLTEGRNQWRANLEKLARPLAAFLIGGPTSQLIFDTRVLNELLARADNIVEAGGTPYFVTSRRTPPGFISQLAKKLPPGAVLYDWNVESAHNPYTGLLALADRYLVTGDSISMIMEVVQLDKPLEILPLPTSWLGTLDQNRRNLADYLFQPYRDTSIGERARVQLARCLFHGRLLRQTRHFSKFHALLVKQGIAHWAGNDLTNCVNARARSPARQQSDEDLEQISRRILGLWENRSDNQNRLSDNNMQE